MRRIGLVLALAGTTLFTAPLVAQSFGNPRGRDQVPPGQEPPPGMCRIWIDGVPPGQQPAPTDCATAIRNRPANGRVLFGDDARRSHRRGDNERREERRDDDRARGSASALPSMIAAVLAGRGQRSADVDRWIGGLDLEPHYSPHYRGAPDRVTWLDRRGAVRQVWIDSDGDGRADVVEIWENGQRVRTLRQ